MALGTALAVTTASSLALTFGPAYRSARQTLRSLGLSSREAAQAAANVGHDFHMQMAWTAVFAGILLVGWVVATRHLRARRPPLSADGRRGRLALGVLVGVIGYGFVAAPLAFAADQIVYAGRPSF